MKRFQVTFITSTGLKERQLAGERETIALLRRLPRLGAEVVSVVAPSGETWTSEEAMQRLAPS